MERESKRREMSPSKHVMTQHWSFVEAPHEPTLRVERKIKEKASAGFSLYVQ